MSRLLAWGRSMLKRRPVATNTTVYASFYTAAELSQQTFNKYYTPEKPDYDLISAARVVTVGSLLYAPTLHFWYKLLDGKFPGKATRAVAAKVCSDQFIMTPTLLAIFFTTLATLEGRSAREELRQKYATAFVANQCFWIPGQIINFSFVPNHLRVVYVASVSFIWINVLCFIKRGKVSKPDDK